MTGYLVPPGKPSRPAICQYTDSILNHPDLAQRLGAAARERSGHEFSVEKMVGRYAQLYRELLG
jgi:glycosyltransferase involved in cell wall biosynthesis